MGGHRTSDKSKRAVPISGSTHTTLWRNEAKHTCVREGVAVWVGDAVSDCEAVVVGDTVGVAVTEAELDDVGGRGSIKVIEPFTVRDTRV